MSSTTSTQYFNRFIISLVIGVFIVLFSLVVFWGIEDAFDIYFPSNSGAFSGNTKGRGFMMILFAVMILIYSLYNLIEYRNITKRPEKRYYHPLKK